LTKLIRPNKGNKVVDMQGNPVGDGEVPLPPEPRTFQFEYEGGGKQQETGFLVVTGAFVGVASGDGILKLLIPMERIMRVMEVPSLEELVLAPRVDENGKRHFRMHAEGGIIGAAMGDNSDETPPPQAA
jgi:hypothetical protein